MENDFDKLRLRLVEFANARDWAKFHSPKNLACALTVEASELLEHFQWMKEDESRNLEPQKLADVESELADIFCYLIYLSEQLGVDVLKATAKKIDMNEMRYPIEKSKGNSKKYTEL